jgi:hypothetical protein
MVFAGVPDWLSAQGYVQYLETVSVPDNAHTLTTQSMLQNRVDAKLFPHETLICAVSLRTRLLYGEMVKQLNRFGYARALAQDKGAFDASWTIWDNDAAVLHTIADRLYIDFTRGDWQVIAGRHRINWGKNLVWNPNDIFNAYSVLDIAYPERAGSDALLVRYYTGPASSLEGAAALSDGGDTVSTALLWNVNTWGWDMQVLGGWSRRDIVGGIGFSGQIKGAAVRGEGTFFQPDSTPKLKKGVFVGSVSCDYMFPFELYIHGSLLYNSDGTTSDAGTGMFFDPTASITAKTLTASRLSFYGQLQYPVTPLLRADISCIGNPYDKSAVVMPQATFSMTDNLELQVYGQLFFGDPGTEFGIEQKIFHASIQSSF